MRVLRVASPHGDDEARGVGGGLLVHELVAPLEPRRGEAQLAQRVVLVRVDARLGSGLGLGLGLGVRVGLGLGLRLGLGASSS